MHQQNQHKLERNSSETDGNIILKILKKTLDANKYATKKTIAQGLLDVALLTANASQLKYILQVGETHDFYTLMLTLIIISIVLQTIQGILCVFLGMSLDINKDQDHNKANTANNIILGVNVFIVTLNVIISVFEMRDDFSENENIKGVADPLLLLNINDKQL